MTPAEMDEAVLLASYKQTKMPCYGCIAAIQSGDPEAFSCDEHKLARALLAAVAERDAASHHVDEARQERDHMFVGATELRAERDALSARLNASHAERNTATARAVAAEQRAEAAERDARSCWSSADADHVRTTERARVVEAIAAFVYDWDTALADIVRNTNWAAPEEES